MPPSPPPPPGAPEAPAVPPLPSDPMWRRFRELHPEVTLVLLPDPTSSGTEPGTGGAADVEPITGEQARTVAEETERLARTIARSLLLDGVPETTWTSPARDRARVRVTVSGATPSDLPDSPVVAMRLSRLGWDTVARPSARPGAVWVEGTQRGRSLRFSAIGDTTVLTLTSPVLPVSDALAGTQGVARG